MIFIKLILFSFLLTHYEILKFMSMIFFYSSFFLAAFILPSNPFGTAVDPLHHASMLWHID
jgi:hypothetical protein